MGILDVLKPKRKESVSPEEEPADEYRLHELVPLITPEMQGVVAERRAQAETMRRYGIKRATAGRI